MYSNLLPSATCNNTNKNENKMNVLRRDNIEINCAL